MQFQQVLAEVVFPFHAVRQAGQFALGIGRIAGHEVVFREFQGDQASFVVVLVDAHAVADGQGRQAGEDGRAAVAFAVGIVPVLFIARQVQVDLAGLELCFLQAEASASRAWNVSMKPFFMTARRPLTFQEINFVMQITFLPYISRILIHFLL